MQNSQKDTADSKLILLGTDLTDNFYSDLSVLALSNVGI
jgi:hypothetical protein